MARLTDPPECLQRMGITQASDNRQPGQRVQPPAGAYTRYFREEIQKWAIKRTADKRSKNSQG